MKKPDGSWDTFDDYVIDFAIDRLAAGKRIALVTLVMIEGSSPRPLGAQMAITEDGDGVGYLSGGCIERAIVSEAVAAIEEGKSRLVRYGRGSKYIDIQLPCGSAIELFFDVHCDRKALTSILEDLEARRTASMMVPSGRSSGLFNRHYQPRRRLIVVGIGPSAIQLALLGSQASFDTVLYSPDNITQRTASAGNILTIPIVKADSLQLRADQRTAIVFMFHDHELEVSLIAAALDTDAFYIGAMGSKTSHRQRVEALSRINVAPGKISRIYGPAGMFSGVKNAHDIAISILAQIISLDLQNARQGGTSTLQELGQG